MEDAIFLNTFLDLLYGDIHFFPKNFDIKVKNTSSELYHKLADIETSNVEHIVLNMFDKHILYMIIFSFVYFLKFILCWCVV